MFSSPEESSAMKEVEVIWKKNKVILDKLDNYIY